jgi:hypothetical protein
MITEQDLLSATESFFRLYWKKEFGKYPIWSDHWFFDGTIPDGDKRGCYALFSKDEIIYIGLGIGRSFGPYIGSGLGDRLKRYWKVNKSGNGPQYTQREKWEEVTSICTIALPEKHYPLAAALEIFLIRQLRPPKNIQHK